MSGEQFVFAFFEEHLHGWEIYSQPQINGSKPDIVVFNPNVGLGIFEVKDWSLLSEDWREYRSAIDQARSYGKLFKPLFFARHNEAIEFPVTVGLIFTRAADADVQRYFSGFLDGTHYTTIAGREALAEGRLEQIFPLALKRSLTSLTETAANDLRSWLIEPFHAWEYQQPLDDDPRQRQFVRNTGEVKLRRMKGSAGSGKSVTLVRRAAKVAAEGKDVLFVRYNNSLVNYLRDICDRTREAHSAQIEWRTFHSQCAAMFSRMGARKEFEELANDNGSWEETIPSRLMEKLDSGKFSIKKFHAIYVDEGQDFNLSWWNLLRRCLHDGGEMMIAFDSAQQIYPRTDWNTKSLPGAGFHGPWIELNGSRRLPRQLLPVLRLFAERFCPIVLDSLPTEVTTPDYSCELRWVQVRPAERMMTSAAELMRIIQRDRTPVSRAMTDLTMLCDSKEDCLAAEKILGELGLCVMNIAGSADHETAAKKRFSMRAPRIKISTFHSYKGWQSRMIVLSVSNLLGNDGVAALYTTLTRVKNHALGSNLTVVCSVPRLRAFGATFPDFEPRDQ